MKISYNLLKEFVELPNDVTPEMVAERLTFSGIEVEECYKVADATKIIVGEIIACENHPKSDHLHLLKVNLGNEYGVVDIVCGAPNARVGIKTIVAMVGAHLKAIDLKISESTILGYKSCGMCCSLKEIGVSESVLSDKDLGGIYEFDFDVKVGATNVLELLGLDDYILDLNILANRPDLLSYLGIAHEVGALFNVKVKNIPELEFKTKGEIEVRSETDKCQEFCILEAEVDGKTKTPQKIKHYLRNLGMRSISLPVDIGNFMMLLTGQPFHFYDQEKVRSLGKEAYIVKDGLEQDVVTLDNKVIKLNKDDLIVTNGETPMCIGGVMGLSNVAIDENTTKIAIESAYFDFARVRHTVNRTSLFSDSSTRFIKKVNRRLTLASLKMLAYVYKKIDPSFKVISYQGYNDEIGAVEPIKYSYEATNNRLGSSFTKKEINDVFKRLNIKVLKDSFLLPPAYRQDLLEQADFDEEVFRYNSSDRLNISLDGFPATTAKRNEKYYKSLKVSNYLVDRGLFEVVSYTLIDKEMDKTYRLFNRSVESVKISNPMTDAHEYIRSDLGSSIIKTIEYNNARQKDDFKIFEIADLYINGATKTYLAIGLSGMKKEQSSLDSRPYDFYDLKGYIEEIFNILNVLPSRYTITRSTNEYLHPGRSAEIYCGKELLAVFGQVSPVYQKKQVFLAEIDLTALMNIKSSATKFAKFSIYPEVERDFCFVLDANKTASDLLLSIKRAAGSSIKNIDIFDIYKISDEKKSIAVRVRFTKFDGTFKDEEIKDLMNRIVESVKKNINGELR